MADDVTEGVAIYIVLSYLKYLARELGLAIYISTIAPQGDQLEVMMYMVN